MLTTNVRGLVLTASAIPYKMSPVNVLIALWHGAKPAGRTTFFSIGERKEYEKLMGTAEKTATVIAEHFTKENNGTYRATFHRLIGRDVPIEFFVQGRTDILTTKEYDAIHGEGAAKRIMANYVSDPNINIVDADNSWQMDKIIKLYERIQALQD